MKLRVWRPLAIHASPISGVRATLAIVSAPTQMGGPGRWTGLGRIETSANR